jgi:hypothetical protein
MELRGGSWIEAGLRKMEDFRLPEELKLGREYG